MVCTRIEYNTQLSHQYHTFLPRTLLIDIRAYQLETNQRRTFFFSSYPDLSLIRIHTYELEPTIIIANYQYHTFLLVPGSRS